MQYRLIIDKQPMDNPSSEKREYKIDIEELRYKGKVHDSLIIKMNKAHVVRRLALSKNHVLKVLLEPIKEPLEDISIELFEGNNYIYLIDMIGNAFYVEYLNKTGFNDVFATRKEMAGAIEVSSRDIELSVEQKLTDYLTSEQARAMINLKADEIREEVSRDYASKDELSAETSQRVQTAESITEEIKKIKQSTISSVDVMYALSDSETTTPTTGWSTTAPTWQDGKYMWQKTIITFTNETTEESQPTCISGANGKDGTNGTNGKDGAKGDTGIGVKKLVEQYYLSNSNVAQTGATWKETQDKWEEGKYIWTRTQITWTDDSVTYTDPVLATSINNLSETTSKVEKKAESIDMEVKKKVNNEDFTAAKFMMMINNDESEMQISADKIDIDGKAVHFKTNISTNIGPFTEADYNKVRNYMMEEGTLTTEEFKKYDITGDGKINSLDIAYMRRAIMNGGYYNFSGTYEVNPYSKDKSIALYDNRGFYQAIISLVHNYFDSLYTSNLYVEDSLNVVGKYGSLVAIDDTHNETFEVVVDGNINTLYGHIYGVENLYENESGSAGTISLSESVANFEYIEIFYDDANNGVCSFVKVPLPNGKSAALQVITKGNDTNLRINAKKVSISGTSITSSNYQIIYTPHDNGSWNSNEIRITKVIGYR